MVRERLTAFAHRHAMLGALGARHSDLVQLAAGHVGLTLDFLAFAIDDVERAQADFLSARTREQAFREGRLRGVWDDDGNAVLDEVRRTYFLLQYRIDSLYVVARSLLDDIAGLLDRALARSAVQIGKHSGVAKHLPKIAADRGLSGADIVAEKAASLSTRVKKFRDDYVIHRSRGRRAHVTRSITVGPDGTPRMLVGGLAFPEPGDQPFVVMSDSPEELKAALDEYLDAVLGLIEPLLPQAREDRVSG